MLHQVSTQSHQSALLLGFAWCLVVFHQAISDQLPFYFALAIECHQQRSDPPLRQVDFVYRRLEPRPAVHFAFEFSRGKKTYPNLNLEAITLYLEWKGRKVSSCYCSALSAKCLCIWGGFFAKPALSRRTWLWTGFSASAGNILISCTWAGRAQGSALQHVALP